MDWEVVTMLHRVFALMAILTALTIATEASAQQQAATAAKPKPPVAAGLEDYRIGPEDILSISVWKNEPMSRVLPVRPDGMISLPLLDDVMAAGLTPTELRNVLAQKLA